MLEGWEWIVIGIVAIVIIMWGPSKIPEFAKALGRAKGEFSKAQKEFTKTATETEHTTNVGNDEMLLSTAKDLGISTSGKTKDQISQEISIKVKALSAAA